jgi:hypothetical protein
MHKVNKTKDPASQNSIKYVREHILTEDHPIVGIHPLIADKIDGREEALNEFRSQLSKFKPKQSVLELGIVNSKNKDRISAFKETITE